MILSGGTTTLGLYDVHKSHNNLGGRDTAGAHPASAIADASGLTQQKINDGLESITEMLAINSPQDGMRVDVKSFYTVNYALTKPISKGGGRFTYDSSKSTVNNGVTIFNGWVRQCNPYSIKASYAGCIGDGVQDSRPSFDILIAYFNSIPTTKTKRLHLDGDVFYLDTVTYLDIGDGTNTAFNLLPNLTIFGNGMEATKILLPNNIMSKFGGSTGSSRIYSVFSNFYTDLNNVELRDFTVDFNVAGGNFYINAEQNDPNVPSGRLVFGINLNPDFKTVDFRVNRVRFKDSWSHNSIMIGSRTNVPVRNDKITIKGCVFDGAGDGVFSDLLRNVVVDHSSIYVASLNSVVSDCKFYNTAGSVVSCGVEFHNFGEVKNCSFNNFTIPLFAVSLEGVGCDIKFTSNTISGATYAFAVDCRDANSKVYICNNTATLGGHTARASFNNLTYAHSGLDNSQAITGANYSTPHDTLLVFKGNTITQLDPIGAWTAADKYINACMSLQEIKDLVAEDNTFINFKGAALRILSQNGEKLRTASKWTLKDNTYVNCGDWNTDDANSGAYIIEGVVAGYAGLGSLLVDGDTFVNCGYGSILSMPNNSIALAGVSIDVKVKGKYINPYYASIDHNNTFSFYKLRIEYDVMPTTVNFREPLGLDVRLHFNGNTASGNNSVYEYIKPKSSYYRLHAQVLGVDTSNNVGFLSPRIGDKIDVLDFYAGAPSQYVYLTKGGVNQWVGYNIV